MQPKVYYMTEARYRDLLAWSSEMTLPRHLFILKPSTIAGVGVFSLQDIQAGESVDDLFDQNEQVRLLDPEVVPQALRDHGVKQEDGTYSYAENLNRMSVGWYMNHSEDANVRSVNDGDTLFVAVKDIKAGDEITIDYRTLEEDFKGYVKVEALDYISAVKQALEPHNVVILEGDLPVLGSVRVPMFDIVSRPVPFKAGEILGLAEVIKCLTKYLTLTEAALVRAESKIPGTSAAKTYVLVAPVDESFHAFGQVVGIHAGIVAVGDVYYAMTGPQGGDIIVKSIR